MTAQQKILEVFSTVESAKSADKVVRLVFQLFNETVLKSIDQAPSIQMHPLGFLALSWAIDQARVLRLHYWSEAFDWAQSSDLQIHDHTFEFTSAVLLGDIRNDVYSIRSVDHGSTLYRTTYTLGKSHLSPELGRVSPTLQTSHNYTVGSFYQMPAGLLHETVLDSREALTVLATRYKSSSRDGARVIGPSTETSVAFQRTGLKEARMTEVLSLLHNALKAASKEVGVLLRESR